MKRSRVKEIEGGKDLFTIGSEDDFLPYWESQGKVDRAMFLFMPSFFFVLQNYFLFISFLGYVDENIYKI